MASKSKNIAGWALAGSLAVVLSGSATESLAAKKRAALHRAAPHRAAQHSAAAATADAPATAGALKTQAMAFESFMRQGRNIDPDFSSASQVSRSLQTGARHAPDQLEAGMIAYAAMAALQERSFVEGVRAEAQGSDLVARISADPNAVLQLSGASAAASRASAALLRQGEDLAKNGERVQRASYTVQHAAWSKTKVANRRGMLAELKRISAVGYRPEAGDAAKLQTALAEGGRQGGAPSPVVTRGVALAALSVLGEEGRGRSLMQDPATGMCLRMAKLNLYQCVAAAGTEYEDIYCLGKHALIDPGQCVSEAALQAPRSRTSVTPASYQH
jgi:hypothetical protein